ncbi:type I restriction-modification system subunit S [Paenibacillus cisolokensis]|uniref:Type I restriction-modification system subunit S n=1 Tax=Paenibacillus cisolokensis TaxID=1658519 RepID=A0ABQ4N0D3_9BACL|nr:restriction endonuclease subunit S [Paenibacillus cisolokensis]GIQ61629.1 type I restriction-modification system subunit S [Paenibacillus cisolokensis]
MIWETITATEFCDSVRDGTHDTPKQASIGKPLITSKHIKNGQILVEHAYLITEQDFENINKRSKVEKWDVLMSMIGTIGEAAVVKDDPDYAIKNIALFKCGDETKAKWLYYFLCSNMGKGQLFGNQKGSSQQFVSLTQLRQLQIPNPPRTTQLKITNVLSAYDDLIENNQKQIKLLEEAAMRLYKEWFVKLRFPGYERTKIVDGVPEGWTLCKLQDVIEFNPVTKLNKNQPKKSLPMAALNTSTMIVDESLIVETTSNSGSKFQNGDTLLARITPCLENGKTAFVNFLNPEEKAVGSTEFIVMRSIKLNPFMVYCLARDDNFRQLAIKSMSGADGRQRVKVEDLKNADFLLPPNHLIESCINHMEPIFNKIKTLNKQCYLLRQARDKLLPRLISEEIEV